MCTYIPVTLQGANLRDRHRYLNSLVSQAYEENIPFDEIITIPERSPIDRIFKIDLASKYENIEYILQNLKDDDMLYVSRSLKCYWLIDPKYRALICPSYLNINLYPEMIQPAVSKMKHWLQLNLKDPERCEEFYNYYKSNIEEAINFFWHCSNEFILSEFPNIVDKLTPFQMKILFETCPPACTLYFENLPNNRPALARYLKDESNYFKCIKYLLKYDGNSFLDIVEKYFNTSIFNPFGPSSTEFIMKHYKSRVIAKIELYTKSILHKKTLAAHLTSDEAKQILLRLARAEYISNWFSYQNVEPFVKRVKMEERTALKKQIFVDKTIDLKVADWPYTLPKPLSLEDEKTKYLLDISHEPHEYAVYDYGFKRCLLKRKYKASKFCDVACEGMSKRSQLDQLFNRYRFTGFEATFREFSKKLLAEGTIEGRLNMMLVLVSKSGGISKQVEKLLKFLVEKHKNETNTLRAAVIRSLVKRERVWSVEDQAWEYLIEFGRDIGLDGANDELICREGLHAVIIRHLLKDTPIPQNLLAGFISNFSTLSEYKLNIEEKALIAKRLPLQLVFSNPIAFLDVLREYKLSIKEFPEATPILVKAASLDMDLVRRLFEAKMLRRELFYKTFTLKQTNAMYLNALRHDINPLEGGKSFALLASKERPNHDRFLQSLSLFFSEPGGLAEQHRMALEDALEKDPKSALIRPLCILLSNELVLKRISDLSTKEKKNDKVQMKILTEFKANAHKTKPSLDIDIIDWRMLGAKAIANKVFVCRNKDQERYLNKLSEWKRTVKISLRLSSNTSFAVNNFLRVCTLRPSAALNIGFSFYLKKTTVDESLWLSMKSLIENTKNLAEKRPLLKILENNCSVPNNIETEYWAFVYKIFLKINKQKAMPMLCHLEYLLPRMDPNLISNIVKEFIDFDLSVTGFVKDSDLNKTRSLYFRIIAKHLLLCKSEDEQKDLLENVCDKFFDALEVLFETEESKSILLDCLDEFIFNLKYTKAFLGEYVTCMPVFERILKRLHKILPIEENFKTYVAIHLTMLFYKSIKQTPKLDSNSFEDTNKCSEAIETVGKVFGKLIGSEIKELISKYFRSIVDIYKKVLKRYMRNYFEFNDGRTLFVTFVIKGILEVKTTEASLLAEHIFQKEQRYYITEPHRAEILNVLKESNDDEVKCFLYEDVLNG